MIGIVLLFLITLVVCLLTFLVLFPVISLITTHFVNAGSMIANMTAGITTNQTLINTSRQLVSSLEFQATAFMWLAQYGWLITAIALFFGVFMITRAWIEFQRGGRIV